MPWRRLSGRRLAVAGLVGPRVSKPGLPARANSEALLLPGRVLPAPPGKIEGRPALGALEAPDALEPAGEMLMSTSGRFRGRCPGREISLSVT